MHKIKSKYCLHHKAPTALVWWVLAASATMATSFVALGAVSAAALSVAAALHPPPLDFMLSSFPGLLITHARSLSWSA